MLILQFQANFSKLNQNPPSTALLEDCEDCVRFFKLLSIQLDSVDITFYLNFLQANIFLIPKVTTAQNYLNLSFEQLENDG